MKTLWAWICRATIVLLPLWSISVLAHTWNQINFTSVFDRSVSSAEINVAVHGSILLLWSLFLIEVLREFNKFGSWSKAIINLRVRPHHLLIGALSLTTNSSTIAIQGSTTEVPASTVISPAIAASILTNILRERREQIRRRFHPLRFSEEQQVLSRKLITVASSNDTAQSHVDVITQSEVVELAKTVDATELPLEEESDVVHEWRLLVRVYGFPQVVSKHGQVAQFRKKRALELASWLALNRDRQRRTAARNALWDIDVSDASFATVVSDLRRALSEADHTLARDQVMPTTYTDDIPLHSSVTTDFELLRSALNRFRGDDGFAQELYEALLLIRDVPFAGTAYSWADYDGTTTRLIVIALEAATEFAQWAIVNDDIDMANDAIVAGLRVMPGCEELLELHKSLLPVAQTSRHRISH